MTLVVGFKIGPIEVAIERHHMVGAKFFSWEIPSTGEIIVDCGKFSAMVTHAGAWRRARLRLQGAGKHNLE